jgi:hypothetical protein
VRPRVAMPINRPVGRFAAKKAKFQGNIVSAASISYRILMGE